MAQTIWQPVVYAKGIMKSRSTYNLKIDTISTYDIPLDRSFLKLWNSIRHVMPSTDRRLELKEKTSMAQNAWQASVYANGLSMEYTTQQFSIKLDVLDEIWGAQSGVAEVSSVPIDCYAIPADSYWHFEVSVMFQNPSKYLPNSMAQQPRTMNPLDLWFPTFFHLCTPWQLFSINCTLHMWK